MNWPFPELPTGVKVSKKLHPIFTDFREWVGFEMLLLDQIVDDVDKYYGAFDWYDEDNPPVSDEAFKALVWFYRGGDKIFEKELSDQGNADKPKIVYDFEEDAELIYASFLDGYGIDLEAVKYLHWWKFRALLINIPERTRLAKAMAYRSTDDKDLSKSEKKIKQILALTKPKNIGQAQTLQQREAAMLERARCALNYSWGKKNEKMG